LLAPAGLGVGWIDHLRPFQRSTNGGSEQGSRPQSGTAVQDPTAVHPLVEVHETPFSALMVVPLAPAGLGVRWSDHFPPFQRSTNGRPEHGS
jgi:hypothetical protein